MRYSLVDALARAAADFPVSRRRALRHLAAGGGALAAVLGAGGAAAACPRHRRCGGRCCEPGHRCRHGGCFARCGNPGACLPDIKRCGGQGAACGCVTTDAGLGLCAEDATCPQLQSCATTADCPRGRVCQVGSCCGVLGGNLGVCVRPCRGPESRAAAAPPGPTAMGR